MAIDFPTTLDTLTNPTASDKTDSPSHAGQHSDLNDAVEAIQAKVGIDSSADTDSIDYKLTNASSSNPGHKHTLAQGATDVTASAAELNILDGVTATAAELNITDGGDATHKVLDNGCMFRAYHGATASLTNGAFYTLAFTTESYDVGGDYEASTSTFTAPVAGYYEFTASFLLQSVAASKTIAIQLRKNSSTFHQVNVNSGGGGNITAKIASGTYLAANDTVIVRGYHDDSTARDMAGNEFSLFMGRLISV